MSNPIQVLVVDDHHVVRAGLEAILQQEPGVTVVASCADGFRAVEAHRLHRPQVVLMDVKMPGMSGIEATRAILRDNPETKVVMLTTYDTEEDIYQAIEAGARGYLLKTALNDEVFTAISRVCSGEVYLPQAVADQLAIRRSAKGLTPRELDVLALAAKGLHNREIGKLLGFSERTARFHLSNILFKLSASDRTEAVSIAIARGILADRS